MSGTAKENFPHKIKRMWEEKRREGKERKERVKREKRGRTEEGGERDGEI